MNEAKRRACAARKRRFARTLAATATSLTAWCAPAPAAQWELRPFIDLGATSESNIQLTTLPHETTSGYVGALRLDGRRTTETSKAMFSGYITHTNYQTGDIPDRTEEGLTLNSEAATSERGKIYFDGEYRHDALFQTAVVRRGTGDVRDVDVAVTSDVEARRSYLVLAPSYNWQLTERSSVRLGYRFTNSSFSHDVGTDLVDYTENILSATYSHQLNPRDDLNLTANAVRYSPATDVNSADTVQLLVGISRAFSETLRGQFAFGGNRTTTQTATGEDTGSGIAANASIRQNTETSAFEGIISRDVTPSGVGQALRTDQFRVWWSRRLSENIEFVFQTQLIDTRALEGGNTGVNRRYFDITPELRWQWVEDLYLVGSVRHRQQKFGTEADTATSNAVFLGLSYRL